MSTADVFWKGVPRLFAIGDKIVYGSEGVYFVAEYTASPVDKNDTRQYYLLKPVFGPAGNVIFTPVDNDRVKMRPVMDKASAESFMGGIPSVDVLTVEREKNRRDMYKATLASATPEDFIAIIKTVHVRREEFLRAKKRLAESDNDYEKKSKFCLYGELALALDVEFADIERMIEEIIAPKTA
jgi:CarD family transcriptional regulator